MCYHEGRQGGKDRFAVVLSGAYMPQTPNLVGTTPHVSRETYSKGTVMKWLELLSDSKKTPCVLAALGGYLIGRTDFISWSKQCMSTMLAWFGF